MPKDIYQTVTDRILEILDRGVVPWRHPIRRSSEGPALPRNLVSNRAYRGINVFLLAVTAWMEGYERPDWLTFRQARERGGHVRRGEKGSLVIFWKRHATTDRQTGEPVTVPVLRHYTVFNADQCEGIGDSTPPPPEDNAEPFAFEPLLEAAAIVNSYENPPRIERKGTAAFYRPSEDLVRVPEPRRYADRESYYCTLFHELAHSTGHSKRLDRGLDTQTRGFGSADYSKEELIAEMGAAFLCAAAGISPATIEQSASYIDGWRKRISTDKKLVVRAAGAGQRAADWVLGGPLSHEAEEQHAATRASNRIDRSL